MRAKLLPAILVCLILPLLALPAAAFQMRNGYFVGNLTSRTIVIESGFQPDLVIIKSDTIAGAAVFSTSAMPSGSSAYFSTASGTFTQGITSLNSNGFSLGNSPVINTANVRYTWVAFAGSGGSDFKVGSYACPVGTVASAEISGLGFQPDLVVVKGDTANYGCWRTSLGGEMTQFFHGLAAGNNEQPNRIKSLTTGSFWIGSAAEVNSSGGIYYYIAFKKVAGTMTVGTYEGTGAEQAITGLGFSPQLLWVRNSTTTGVTNYSPLRSNQNYGNESQYFSATANATNEIRSLDADGFTVGPGIRVNDNTKVFHYAAFAGVTAEAPTGTFKYASGSYLGTTTEAITGLGFRPDLVIIKSGGANSAVFATSQMPADYYAFQGTATAMVATNGITIQADGFSLGTAIPDANLNGPATTYYWEAFGNSGCADFKVGAYTGLGATSDDRSITGLGFKPDLVGLKINVATSGQGVWRTSAMTGDSAATFIALADATNYIQTLEADGFQVGSSVATNSPLNIAYYYAFKSSSDKLNLGTYTGNNNNYRSITGPGFQPELVWIKRSTAVAGVHRASTVSSTQLFTAAVNLNNVINTFESNGFSFGTALTNVNTAPDDYWYAAWRSSGAASKLVFSTQPTSAQAGTAISPAMTVRIEDQYDNLVTSDNSTPVTIALGTNPGNGTLSGTLTRTASNGVVTFDDLSINKTGSGYALTTTSTGLASATSSGFNVTPAAASKLVYTVQPSTAEAGVVLTPEVKVAVRDQYDNLVATDNNTAVTLTIATNPGSGTAFGTLTKTATAGVAAFNDIYLNKSGAGYKLQVAASGLTAATSEGFDITGSLARPTIASVSPSREGNNVPIASSVKIVFSQNMDQTAVASAFSLKAVKDNKNNPIETSVTGTTTWDGLSRQFTFTPTAALTKGYTFQTSLAATARNSDLITLTSAESWQFTVIYDHTKENTTYSTDRLASVKTGSGTIPNDGFILINRDPRHAPTVVDPAKITDAINKVLAEGDAQHFPLQATITEFNLYDSSGTRVATTFAEAAAIALYYNDVNNDGIVDGTIPPFLEKNLVLYRLDEAHGLFVRVPGSTVNTVDNYVSAPVRGFSVYTAMATPVVILTTVYAYPNPFKPSAGHTTVTFTNLASQCTIKVYTLSGDLVKTISENSGTGQNVWDVKNEGGEPLASGTYLYFVKSSADTKTGKLVVIR